MKEVNQEIKESFEIVYKLLTHPYLEYTFEPARYLIHSVSSSSTPVSQHSLFHTDRRDIEIHFSVFLDR